MKNLIPITDFVLKEMNNLILNGAGSVVAKIGNYARFLRQTLEIWMFVPCKLVDGVWFVLEEPKDYYWFENNVELTRTFDENVKFLEYQQAKERCLFEGFEMYNGNPYNNKLQRAYSKNHIDEWWTIENIIHWNLELTQTAIKQLAS